MSENSTINGVVKCKNHILEELIRTMLSEMSLPKYFWIDDNIHKDDPPPKIT